MKKILWVVCVTSAFAFYGMANNLHWQGVGSSGVGDFEVPANWTEGSVPSVSDLAAVNNRSSANWAVNFNSDVTNVTGSLVAPSENYGTVFNLNQHTWTATSNLSVWEGSGGRVTFTNGFLRAGSLNGETAPPSGSTRTNHSVITFQSVRSASVNASFAGSITTFSGGEHSVSNQMKVGTYSGSPAYATVFLMNGVRFAVTNELHIGEATGATGRVDVADADFQAGINANYLGYSIRGKGTLTVGTGANVFIPGYFHAGLNGHGVVEQMGGVCIVSNFFEIGENTGARGELNPARWPIYRSRSTSFDHQLCPFRL